MNGAVFEKKKIIIKGMLTLVGSKDCITFFGAARHIKRFLFTTREFRLLNLLKRFCC
jgi:hypothetical protein